MSNNVSQSKDFHKIANHRLIWREKRILRHIYKGWYEQMMAESVPGTILEIGSGTASIKDFYKNVISSDIIFCPWLDVIFNTVCIPFKNSSVTTMLSLDVLHHIENRHIPQFFDEASRVLKVGGRLILLEPYISPFSYVIYKIFHKEPVDCRATVLQKTRTNPPDEEAFKKISGDANQAISKILFWREESLFRQEFPQLSILKKVLFSFLVYPLSGGYESRSCIPITMFNFCQAIEHMVPWPKSLSAFRTLLVIEKNR